MRGLLISLPVLLLAACSGKDKDSGWVYIPPDTETTGCDTGDDADCDGYPDDVDCDPNDPYSNPGMTEIPYDGRDNDCGGDGDLTDVDADGHEGAQVGGDDCNDGNPDAYPGAKEECYNATDEDCDGVAQGYEDNDCDQDGYQDRGEDGDDCDPSDPAINPGAAEIWYDGIDQNCDGESDYDADQDGENAVIYGGTDCDDTDVTVNSRTIELWDGVDNNCNTILDDIDVADAWQSVEATSTSIDGQLGWSVAALGDLSGDGYADIAAGAPESDPSGTGADPTGLVRIFSSKGTSGTPSSVSFSTITGSGAGDSLGWDLVAVGDINKDGDADLLVGAPGAQAAYLFSGAALATTASMTPSSALATLLVSEDVFGADVVALGDLDGDGLAEVGVGSASYLLDGQSWMGVWTGRDLAAGGTLGDGDTLASISDRSIGGESMGGGDLDGDGLGDLAVVIDADSAGTVVILTSGDLLIGGDFGASDLPALDGPAGVRGGVHLGFLSDADGDGYSELVYSAPDQATAAGVAGGGIVYVIDGDVATSADGALTSLSGFTISGTTAHSGLASLDQGGDFDGDGLSDLVVSTVGDSTATVISSAYVFYGDQVSDGGAYLLSARLASFLADDTQDYTGYAGTTADIEGDGDDDLIIGVPYADVRAGSVHVYRSLLVAE